MKKDDIRTFITILIICTLIVGFVLILNRKSNSEKLEVVNEYNSFFTVTNYVNDYINKISISDGSKLYDLLYYDYIDKNNITMDNIFNDLDKVPFDTSLKVSKMEYVKVKNDYIYYVEGRLYQLTFDGNSLISDNFKVLVLTDFDTLSYAIYPLSNEDNYKKVIDKFKKIRIENNSNNNIKESSLISKEQICVLYLSDYINRILNDDDYGYNLLEDKLKEKYTLDEYKEYIKNNINKISTEANKCSLEMLKSNRIYTVIDKNNNKYIFNEKNIMNYNVNFYLNNESE